jgi:SAM-dependent methyltransferase
MEMAGQPDWIWDIICCPECSGPLRPGEQVDQILCGNPACGFASHRQGRLLNLLPKALDQHQQAENAFRERINQQRADEVIQMSADQLRRYRLLNQITYYAFTSQYFIFRDTFSKQYSLQGRGLEIGGAMGQLSGFVRLFYPNTQMVASDVAPFNLELGIELAELLGFETEYFVMADAERLPFQPESFDFICSSGMLHHLGNLPQALQHGRAALKPNGRWYSVNELAIGGLPRLIWNSRLGQKGRWADDTGIRENSYTLKEWQAFFKDQGFRIVDQRFHRNPKHKLLSWPRALYYALIARLPSGLIRMGIPCEVNFVLEKD